MLGHALIVRSPGGPRTPSGMLFPVLVTNHVLSGAVLGATALLSRRPLVAFCVGFASHFALDATPHWGDTGPELPLRVAVPDGLTGLAAMAAMTWLAPPRRRPAVLAAMAGASAPDLDKPSHLFFGASPYPAGFDAFHQRVQRESSRRMPQEFAVAALLGALAVVLLHRRAPVG